jgi:hypothetical protein
MRSALGIGWSIGASSIVAPDYSGKRDPAGETGTGRWHGGLCQDAGLADAGAMRVVIQTNDPVRLSFLMALLRDAGIGCVLLDAHVSAMEGSIGAIPRRLMVDDADEPQARRVLREAGEA